MRTKFCIVLVSLLTFSCSHKNNPVLEFSEYSVDFGTVKEGTLLSTSVTVYNRGISELTIRSVRTDCSCTNATLDKRRIEAEDSATLYLSLDTHGKLGTTENYAILETNTDSVIHYISISSEVVPH